MSQQFSNQLLHYHIYQRESLPISYLLLVLQIFDLSCYLDSFTGYIDIVSVEAVLTSIRVSVERHTMLLVYFLCLTMIR